MHLIYLNPKNNRNGIVKTVTTRTATSLRTEAQMHKMSVMVIAGVRVFGAGCRQKSVETRLFSVVQTMSE